MNLIEITKGYEPKQNEQTEQMKSLPDITDKWKQLAKEQAASLELVTEERDKLQVRNQKMNEFTDSYQYLIGVSLPNVIEPWLNNFVDVFTEKVSQDKKINVIFRDAAGNPEKQIQDIETLMEYGIDILIVSPDGSDSLSSVLSEAFQKIPVILTGVGAGTEDYTCLIKSDDQKIGRLAGEYILNNLYEKNKKIVVFQGVEESPVSKQRLKGFQDSVQGTIPEEDITYYCGDWLRDRAELRMKDYLISHDSADIVFAFNDDMAYGAYQACQQYRIEGKVHLIGVDGFEGESAGLSLVDKGVLDATIQTPDFGGLSYEIARKLLEGNKVEKNIIIQPELILQGGAERKE